MKQRTRGLGRGLDSLIPTREGDVMVPQMVAVDQIRPLTSRCARGSTPSRWASWPSRSAVTAVLQPILVRRLPDGTSSSLGERRWRAARLAGLTSVPAVVRFDDGNDASSSSVHREPAAHGPRPHRRGRRAEALTEEFGLTHEEVAQKIGKHRVSVSQSLRLLNGCARSNHRWRPASSARATPARSSPWSRKQRRSTA